MYQHKNNNDKHPNYQLRKACKCLEYSQMWWRCHWLSLQFNQYLRQLTKTEYPQALSFSRNVFTHGRNEIFPTFISPIRDDLKFPGRIIGEGIKPLRCIRKRHLSFAHTMCCIFFFLFLILKLLHLFAAVTSQFQIRVKFCGRSNWTVKLFFSPFFFCCFRSDAIFFCCKSYHAFYGHIFFSNVWLELMQVWFHRVHAFLFFVKFSYQHFLLQSHVQK